MQIQVKRYFFIILIVNIINKFFNHFILAIRFQQGYAQFPVGIYFYPEFTFMIWIKPLSYNNYQRVFDFGNGYSNRNLVLAFIAKTSGALLFVNGKLKQTTDVFPLNIWTHVVVTSTNKDIIFYLNGEQKLVVNGSLERTETKLNYIGKSLYASDSNIDAVLDEFKIFDRSLTKEEI